MNKCRHPSSSRIYWKVEKQMTILLCNKELWQSSRIYQDWQYTVRMTHCIHTKLHTLHIKDALLKIGFIYSEPDKCFLVCVCVCTVLICKVFWHLAFSNFAHKVLCVASLNPLVLSPPLYHIVFICWDSTCFFFFPKVKTLAFSFLDTLFSLFIHSS